MKPISPYTTKASKNTKFSIRFFSETSTVTPPHPFFAFLTWVSHYLTAAKVLKTSEREKILGANVLKHRHAVHAEPVTFFLSLVTRHLNLYASEQKLVWWKYTRTLPSLGSDALTFWGTPDFFIAVTSQCSRIRVYSHAGKVLRDLGHVSPRLGQKYFASDSRLSFIIVPLLLTV